MKKLTPAQVKKKFPTLEELCEAINDGTLCGEDGENSKYECDTTEFPIYDTAQNQNLFSDEGQWSWNDTHVMVGDGTPFELKPYTIIDGEPVTERVA
jgi:hypothetical protein